VAEKEGLARPRAFEVLRLYQRSGRRERKWVVWVVSEFGGDGDQREGSESIVCLHLDDTWPSDQGGLFMSSELSSTSALDA
jgi:hypothetical protein